jgi:hypothetical protein
MDKRPGAVGVLALIIGLAGCAGTPERSAVPAAAPSSSQSGPSGPAAPPVSRAHYEAAVAAAGTCLAEHRIELVVMGWNPVHQQRMVLSFRNTALPDDVVSAHGERCLAVHLLPVEQRYVRQTEPVMDAELLSRSRKCLSAHHVATTGRERNGPDLLRSATGRHEKTVYKCVSQTAAELYPTHPIPVEL